MAVVHRPPNEGPCSIEGCDNPSQTARLCRMHYSRQWRTGDPGEAKSRQPGVHATTQGYLVEVDPSHPLSQSSGLVLQHRKVLFQKIGPGPHRCNWCGLIVEWGDSLVTDHVDGDRQNNDPSNLVASCISCNVSRGTRS